MKKLLFVLSVLLFVSLGASAQTAAKVEGPEIKFTATVHDYGTISQNANGDCTFRFKNVGTEPLIISDVRKSCGCTTPTWSKEPIFPGQTGEIKVGYNTASIGGFSKTITVISNAVSANVVLTIKGNVVAK
mgnify:CR=1 FL=1